MVDESWLPFLKVHPSERRWPDCPSVSAVLARLLWPTQLTTDLLAGQAFGVQVRQMTRWNTRIAELTASICQAAGIDQATWAIPAKIKAIGGAVVVQGARAVDSPFYHRCSICAVNVL